jgi:uncharacterized protein with GYD domain
MAKYLLVGSYTAEGARGALKEGGTARRKAADQVVETAGGKLESFYWAFGEDDFYSIVDFPNAASAAAAAMTLGGSGAVKVRTVVLITAEELDAASKVSVTYRPPGR